MLEYTLGDILKLFVRTQIFSHEEILSKREFLDKKSGEAVEKALGQIKELFFKVVEKEEEVEREITDDADVAAYQMLSQNFPFVEFVDATK